MSTTPTWVRSPTEFSGDYCGTESTLHHSHRGTLDPARNSDSAIRSALNSLAVLPAIRAVTAKGRHFFGFTSVAAPGNLSPTCSVTVPEGSQLTATATSDANTNTSQFSAVHASHAGSTSVILSYCARGANHSQSDRRFYAPDGADVPVDWTDVKCAVTYKIVVKQGSQSGPRVDRQGGLTDSNTVTKTLPRNNKYFFRAPACNPVSCGPGRHTINFALARHQPLRLTSENSQAQKKARPNPDGLAHLSLVSSAISSSSAPSTLRSCSAGVRSGVTAPTPPSEVGLLVPGRPVQGFPTCDRYCRSSE